MNTQLMGMPGQGEVRAKESSSPAVRGVERPAPTDKAGELDEEKGEDAPFGAALQSVIATERPIASRPGGLPRGPKSGAWDVTASLVKRSKAVGRVLRGISELAIARPQGSVSAPSLVELNAAGGEFAGKGAFVGEADSDVVAPAQAQEASVILPKEGLEGERASARTLTRTGVPGAAAASQAQAQAQAAVAAETGHGDQDGPVDDEVPDEGTPRMVTATGGREEVVAKGQRAALLRHGPGEGEVDERPANLGPIRPSAEVASAQDAATRIRTASEVLTAAGSEAPARVARVSEQLAIMVRDGTSRAQMELHPPDLGRVTLEVEVRGDQVAVKMVVESQEAHQRLRSDAEALAKSLQEQGLSLAGMDVSVDRRGAGEDEDEEATGLTSIEAALSELRGDEALEPRTRRVHAGEVDLRA